MCAVDETSGVGRCFVVFQEDFRKTVEIKFGSVFLGIRIGNLLFSYGIRNFGVV